MTRTQLILALVLAIMVVLSAASRPDPWNSLPFAGSRFIRPPLYDTAVR